MESPNRIITSETSRLQISFFTFSAFLCYNAKAHWQRTARNFYLYFAKSQVYQFTKIPCRAVNLAHGQFFRNFFHNMEIYIFFVMACVTALILFVTVQLLKFLVHLFIFLAEIMAVVISIFQNQNSAFFQNPAYFLIGFIRMLQIPEYIS